MSQNFCVNLVKNQKGHLANLDINLYQITKFFGRLLNIFSQLNLKLK